MAWESAQLFEKARFMEGSEIWISFRRIWISFRRTLILFRLVLISFRWILNSFHASWRLERGAARTRFGVAEKDLHLQRARTLQRGRSRPLGRRKSAALAARCRHERGSRQEPFGKRTPQSRGSPPHGDERHAKGRRKRITARQDQASRLGSSLPRPATDPLLKCDRPGRRRPPT